MHMCTVFITSSVDEHLGGFYLLTIMNNAAVNMGVTVSESLLSFLGTYTSE